MKKYKYSEIFSKSGTFQGEGKYAGHPTVWVRFWGCNLNCDGFGQKNPYDKTTYDLPYKNIDISNITKIEDVPVFEKGCDSSYSWSKKFSHLVHTATINEICNELEECLYSKFNPSNSFLHDKSKQWTHMAFTGGEPMLNQNAIVEILNEFENRKNSPRFITIETNGTQKPRDKFSEYANYLEINGQELFWSVSPKLSTSGEDILKTIRPDIVLKYYELSDVGQLKYVCDGTNKCWDEVESSTEKFRKVGIDWPVWIMPVGADIESQNKIAANVAEESVKRGYNIAARIHCYIFQNVIGK